MILVSNNAHNNGIYTYIDDSAGLVIKSSYVPEGVDRLEREHAGYAWFFRLTGLADRDLQMLAKRANGSYARLTVRRFPGRVGNSYRSLSDNHSDLGAAIEWYGRIWPRFSGLGPIHGDFALSNMVFRGQEIALVDWEHFHPAGAPWGMDLLALLYESLAFSLHGRPYLRQKDEMVFRSARSAIRSLLSEGAGLVCSLETLSTFVSSHTSIWGGLAQKLPIMHLTGAQREFVHRLDLS